MRERARQIAAVVKAGGRRRLSTAGGLALLATVLLLAAPVASPAAEACPDPSDPDADYLCSGGPDFNTAALTDVAGWDEASHWSNIFYADLDGDELDELVARGPAGVQVYRWQPGYGQWLQLAVAPILSDAEGWNDRSRYASLDLGDVDGAPGAAAELIARGPSGVIVFEFVKEGELGGTWRQLNQSGPLPIPADGLSEPRDVATIELTPLGAAAGRATMQLAARTKLGYELWRWSGGGWQFQARLGDFADGEPLGEPRYYATAEAWDRETLIVRGPLGLRVYRYDEGRREWRMESSRGPCSTVDAGGSFPCDLATIQLARGVPGAGGEPVLLARDSRPKRGIILARYERRMQRWLYPDQHPNPWNEAAYGRLEYASTIQAADLDGDGADEVLGRAGRGIAAFRLNFRGDGLIGWGVPMSVGKPGLDGSPWNLARHFATIETARLTPGSRARSLLARGPYGIRAWHFDRGRKEFERPRPYGQFAAIEPALLARIDAFLGIERGSIRDLLTDPTRQASPSRLLGLQNDLASRCRELAGSAPPRYGHCDPPPGNGIAARAWTDASNELLRELFWARQASEHFDRVAAIQSDLFLDSQGQFPSMVTDLKLVPGIREVRTTVDVGALVGTVIEVAVAAEIPKVSKAVGAIGLLLSGLSAIGVEETGKEAPNQFDVAVGEMQRAIAKMQQQGRDALERQRRLVVGDPGLAATVGRLSLNGVWNADRLQLLSAGRQGFALDVYRKLLPKVWDEWVVTDCGRTVTRSFNCYPPQPGMLLGVRYRPYPHDHVADFSGLVPKQEPCPSGGLDTWNRNRNCRWTSLEDAGYGPLVKVLTDAVAPECRYDPATGSSWRYGCALGVPTDLLINRTPKSPWNFQLRRCVYPEYNRPSVSCHVAQE